MDTLGAGVSEVRICIRCVIRAREGHNPTLTTTTYLHRSSQNSSDTSPKLLIRRGQVDFTPASTAPKIIHHVRLILNVNIQTIIQLLA